MVPGHTITLEVVRSILRNVRFGSKADILAVSRHVRFTPKSGHRRATVGCPVSANKRHRAPYSKAKTRFQSFFMLMTIQPFFFASSSSAAAKVPNLLSGRPRAGP
jgi:hypothetical protein